LLIDNTTHMVPIISPDTKEIVGYRYMMEEKTKVHVLKKRDHVHTTLGGMLASVTDKVESKRVNKDIVHLLKDEYDKNYNSRTQREFVKVGINSTDPRYKELFQMMPKDMRREMEAVWGEKNMFMREELADMIFGYRKFSLGTTLTQTKVFDEFHRINKTVKYIEGIMQEIVGIAKSKIVILNPIVITGNILSNILLSLTKGVPINYQRKHAGTAIAAINNYQQDIARRSELSNKLKAFRGTATAARIKELEVKLAEVEYDIKTNPVRPLIDEGLFQSIVEDVDTTTEREFTYLDQVTEFITNNKHIGKIPKIELMQEGFNQLTISKQTANYALALKVTQYSDFVARFAMHKWLTEEKGVSHADAVEEVVETFINYDIPQSKQLQYINDMGIFMFTKFLLRIQRVIYKISKHNPISSFALYAGQKAFGDMSDIHDSNLITASLLSRFELNPFGHVDDATDLSLLNFIPFFSMLFE